MSAASNNAQEAAFRASEGRFRVLLGTFDGAAFLEAQLASLHSQSVATLDVLISDDGSTDRTPQIINEWAARWDKGVVTTMDGPRRGFAENYRALILATEPETADWFAFCDQDDLWQPDKLGVAAARLQSLPDNTPGLYCSRTRLISETGHPIGYSPVMKRAPSFRNALVQSIAGGNTMVMNRSAFRLLREACSRTGFVSHDWWAYLVITGAGGQVIYDPQPHVLYRQHGGNIIGSNNGLTDKFARVKLLLQGRFREWTSRNMAGLVAVSDLLSPENRHVFEVLHATRNRSCFAFLQSLRRFGIHRQSRAGNATLFLGALLNRI